MLRQGVDFLFEAGFVVFPSAPGVVIDICSGCAWPERFTRDEIERRRKETRTLNAWDSQYMLEAKPLAELRLDPSKLKAYNVEPVVRRANGGVAMAGHGADRRRRVPLGSF